MSTALSILSEMIVSLEKSKASLSLLASLPVDGKDKGRDKDSDREGWSDGGASSKKRSSRHTTPNYHNPYNPHKAPSASASDTDDSRPYRLAGQPPTLPRSSSSSGSNSDGDQEGQEDHDGFGGYDGRGGRRGREHGSSKSRSSAPRTAHAHAPAHAHKTARAHPMMDFTGSRSRGYAAAESPQLFSASMPLPARNRLSDTGDFSSAVAEEAAVDAAAAAAAAAADYDDRMGSVRGSGNFSDTGEELLHIDDLTINRDDFTTLYNTLTGANRAAALSSVQDSVFSSGGIGGGWNGGGNVQYTSAGYMWEGKKCDKAQGRIARVCVAHGSLIKVCNISFAVASFITIILFFIQGRFSVLFC